MRAPSSLSRAALLICGLTLAACGGGERVPRSAGPGDVALRLFEVAAAADPSREQLDALFVLTDDDALRADLGDALERLPAAQSPQVVVVEPLAGSGKIAVDLEADLPGGGAATYSVQLVEHDETYKIVWFEGPGVDWPRWRRGRGSGLTSSPPPGGEPG